MSNRQRIVPLALAVVMAAIAAPATAAEYVQSSGSLGFSGAYQGETFEGVFPDFRTVLSFDPAVPEDARLEVTIPLASASTGHADRDSTLKSDAFFNVASFDTARYTAQGFRAVGEGRYIADGTLELRGVSRPVQLSIAWTPGPEPVLSGEARVSRLDFGVGAGDWGDVSIIPDEVAIATEVRLQPAS